MIRRALWLVLLWGLPVIGQSDTSLWQPAPLVTSGQRTTTTPGGEGGQQIQFIATDASASTTLLLGEDVGGMQVNYNGGACCWQPANIGFACQGAESGAIDPNNSAHMLIAGCSSGSTTWAGLWGSTTAGQSWSRIVPLTATNVDVYTTQIAYDKASVSGGQSVTVYYLSDTTAGTRALYRSVNGGSSFATVNTASACCTNGGWVAVAPTGGDVYIANSVGFWQSTNFGSTFTETVTAAMNGLAVTPAAASNVYITENAVGILKSTTNGTANSFSNVGTTGLSLTGGGLINGTVSPLAANVLYVVTAAGSGNEIPYFSVNSGANWATAVQTNTAGFLPAFQRNGTVVESYGNSDSAYTNTSGDFVAQCWSNGASCTFLWHNDGYLGATLQSITNFNWSNPNLVFMPTQDYNSASSSDGGNTWNWYNVSGTSFGFNYGGGAMFADGSHMFVGNTGTVGNPITLLSSINSGTSWANAAPSPITVSGSANLQNVACDCPGDTSTAYWNFWVTHNQGVSWVTIGSNVQGVFTYDYSNGVTIYGVAGTGASGITIVKSGNNGSTWSAAATESLGDGFLIDIAYDWKNNILYGACNTGALIQWKAGTATAITSRLPTDSAGNQDVDTVCVDPVNPNIVYAGFYTGLYNTTVAVAWSRDAGATWKNLTMAAGDIGIDGGTGPTCLRVNKWTRMLYSSGGVYGLWRRPPPASDQTTAVKVRSRR